MNGRSADSNDACAHLRVSAKLFLALRSKWSLQRFGDEDMTTDMCWRIGLAQEVPDIRQDPDAPFQSCVDLGIYLKT